MNYHYLLSFLIRYSQQELTHKLDMVTSGFDPKSTLKLMMVPPFQSSNYLLLLWMKFDALFCCTPP